jgi:hypothetical protein
MALPERPESRTADAEATPSDSGTTCALLRCTGKGEAAFRDGAGRRTEMSDYNLIYLLAGATLVLVILMGMWQMRRTGGARHHDEHSALTEVEEARRKMLH